MTMLASCWRSSTRSSGLITAFTAPLFKTDSGDIGRHQVGCKLDAGKVAAQHMRESAYQQGFGDTGHAFNKRMLSGEDGDKRFFHDVMLPNNDLGYFLSRLCEHFF